MSRCRVKTDLTQFLLYSLLIKSYQEIRNQAHLHVLVRTLARSTRGLVLFLLAGVDESVTDWVIFSVGVIRIRY